MPRPRKPARLWQRKDGRWVILHGGRHIRTGASGRNGREAAEAALAEYLAAQIEATAPQQPSQVNIGKVLALYLKHKQDAKAAATLAYSAQALLPFWGDLSADAVKGSTCRRYIASRKVSHGTTRRELGVLQAALNLAHAEGWLIYAPRVTLPPSPPPRDRWLTRDEVARLLRAAPPHLQRFILISLATGRRQSAVLELRWQSSLNSGWVDLDAGMIHFAGRRQIETGKRRGSVSMPRGLAAHMRRWSRAGGSHVVMWRGKPVAEIDTAFDASAARAGVSGTSPHVLKHTAVTWAFQKGMTLEDASDWFATTPATLMRVYRQHSPDHQRRAREIMERR